MENPYIEQATVFLKESEGDNFIIAHMQVNHRYSTPEDPIFLHDKLLNAKLIRIAGFEDDGTRSVLYHAESPEQAETILNLFLQGKGYSINKYPVYFEAAPDYLPGDLEGIAKNSIEQYRGIHAVARR